MNVTPQTGSASVAGFPLTENLTSTSPGCVSTTNGTVCTYGYGLPPGAYDATLTTFDGANGTGNQLSAAQRLPFTVVLNQTNTIPLVLGGVPVSMQLVAGTGVTSAHLSTLTLAGNSSGTLDAYGVDADGNTIIGAGAPAATATTSDATQIAVTQSTASAPSAIGVTTLTAQAIARVTATITASAAAGGATFSQTALVQASTVPFLYIISNNGHIFDMTGTEITPPTSGFAAFVNPGGIGMTYDPANGFLYAKVDNGNISESINAFDRNGNQQTLAAAASTLPLYGGIAFDPNNGYLYVAAASSAYDAAGNAHALSSTLPAGGTMTFDPTHNLIVDGTETFNAAGVLQSTLPFTGQIDGGVIYSPHNGFFYVATVYPTMVTAYDTNGNPQVLSGTFLNGSSEQIGGIAADPVSGNIFLSTNARKTYGFDANGNPLPAPWHDIANVGAGSGYAGLTLVAP